MFQDEKTDGPSYMDLMDCLSTIYFAKRAAQKDPQVGDFTSILVLTRKGHMELSDEAWEYLKENMKPIEAPKGLNFKDDFLRTSSP